MSSAFAREHEYAQPQAHAPGNLLLLVTLFFGGLQMQSSVEQAMASEAEVSEIKPICHP